MEAAGHKFTRGVCDTCQRHWCDIRNCTTADIGQHGISHSGQLSAYELGTIITARDAETAQIEAAMADLGR